MRISVIGCGYLGAVHAAVMARLGHQVVGVDVNPERVEVLASGHAPFYEPGLAPLLADGTRTGSLRFTTDSAAARGSTIHFLCVGTPQVAAGDQADLSALDASVLSLLPHLGAEDLVVGKSTVPVGTARSLASWLGEGEERGRLAWNPEFLREGHAVEDTLHPDRLVYGVERGPLGELDTALLDEVYDRLLREGVPRIVTDYATAELAKVAANSFLATKISFVNAMAEVCEASGGDAAALARTLASDSRIGADYLGVGLGFGGGCLPKDIRAFAARAEELGAGPAVAFLHEIDQINDRCLDRAVELVRRAAGTGGLDGVRVSVLGAAFKPESDDVRSSPSLGLARRLASRGAQVVVTDPQAVPLAQLAAPELRYAVDLAEAVTGADVVVLATEWDEYRRLEPERLKALVRRPCVVDTRGAWDLPGWQRAGFTALALGRPGEGSWEPDPAPRPPSRSSASGNA
ncbi:UDP-glucose dehydrogenase family protein [Oerskovia sp. USHLN155]|uniref:UDP-glucose dehydrogenase family protein n=1 Tax=Oerskovia sp. USHLN155 TaxID=3081288 RepID=UPI003017EE23